MPIIPVYTSMTRSAPVTIRIPAIDVSGPVVGTGLDSHQQLVVPPLDYTGTHEAAWYDLGPTPGQTGSSVIVGHVDSTSGPGIFYRLGELGRGDRIMVTLADHDTAVFTVTSAYSYSKAQFPTEAVYGPAAVPVLRLVTCGGAFDYSSGHYESNTVVFATLTAADTAT